MRCVGDWHFSHPRVRWTVVRPGLGVSSRRRLCTPGHYSPKTCRKWSEREKESEMAKRSHRRGMLADRFSKGLPLDGFDFGVGVNASWWVFGTVNASTLSCGRTGCREPGKQEEEVDSSTKLSFLLSMALLGTHLTTQDTRPMLRTCLAFRINGRRRAPAHRRRFFGRRGWEGHARVRLALVRE